MEKVEGALGSWKLLESLIWPIRLLARTPPFQGGKAGSIPAWAVMVFDNSSVEERPQWRD